MNIALSSPLGSQLGHSPQKLTCLVKRLDSFDCWLLIVDCWLLIFMIHDSLLILDIKYEALWNLPFYSKYLMHAEGFSNAKEPVARGWGSKAAFTTCWSTLPPLFRCSWSGTYRRISLQAVCHTAHYGLKRSVRCRVLWYATTLINKNALICPNAKCKNANHLSAYSRLFGATGSSTTAVLVLDEISALYDQPMQSVRRAARGYVFPLKKISKWYVVKKVTDLPREPLIAWWAAAPRLFQVAGIHYLALLFRLRIFGDIRTCGKYAGQGALSSSHHNHNHNPATSLCLHFYSQRLKRPDATLQVAQGAQGAQGARGARGAPKSHGPKICRKGRWGKEMKQAV